MRRRGKPRALDRKRVTREAGFLNRRRAATEPAPARPCDGCMIGLSYRRVTTAGPAALMLLSIMETAVWIRIKRDLFINFYINISWKFSL